MRTVIGATFIKRQKKQTKLILVSENYKSYFLSKKKKKEFDTRVFGGGEIIICSFF